jgi:hypothetical protein
VDTDGAQTQVTCTGNSFLDKAKFSNECSDCVQDDTDCCTDCACNPVGASSPNCDAAGACSCNSGYGGLKCGICLPEYFPFGPGCGDGSCTNNPYAVTDVLELGSGVECIAKT